MKKGITLFFLLFLSVGLILSNNSISATGIVEIDEISDTGDDMTANMEDRIGVYCPTTKAIYTFGGDASGSFSDDITRWYISGGSNAVVVANLTETVCKVGVVYSENEDCIYVLGGRNSTGAEQGCEQIWKFFPSNNTVILLGDYLPYGGAHSMTSTAFSPIQNCSYSLIGRCDNTEVGINGEIWRYNVSNDTFLDTGQRLGCNYSTDAVAVYVPDDDSIYFFGGRGIPITVATKKYIYKFWCSNETIQNLSSTNSIYSPVRGEGWSAYYNTLNNHIFVFGGNDVGGIGYYNFTWTLCPSNNTVTNLSAVYGTYIPAKTDDLFAVYINETVNKGYLVGIAAEGGQSPANMNDIFMVNHSALPNNPPTITNPNPANESTGADIGSYLSVAINDTDGDATTFYFNSNASGSWIEYANSSCGNCSWGINAFVYDLFESLETLYYWSINLTDGTAWVNETYHFTTRGNTAPSISNIVPSNKTTDWSVNSKTFSFDIADPDGDYIIFNATLNVTGDYNNVVITDWKENGTYYLTASTLLPLTNYSFNISYGDYVLGGTGGPSDRYFQGYVNETFWFVTGATPTGIDFDGLNAAATGLFIVIVAIFSLSAIVAMIGKWNMK